MQVVLMVIPYQTSKWVTPLVLFKFKDKNNPKAPQNEKQKNIISSSSLNIGRTKTYYDNVTRKQRDNNKKNTGNK